MGGNNECKYNVFLQESAWQAIVHILQMIQYQTGTQSRDIRSDMEQEQCGGLVTTLANHFYTYDCNM